MTEMIAGKSRLVPFCSDHPFGTDAARVVDEHVNLVGERGDLVGHAGGIRENSQIPADDIDPHARRGRSANVRRRRRGSLRITPERDHAPAARGQRSRGGEPHAGAGTRDHRNAAFSLRRHVQNPMDRAFPALTLDVIIGYEDQRRENGMGGAIALPASNVGQRRVNKPRRSAGAPKPKRRPGAGRPTREQAELRHEELLDRALELFLKSGFEVTTIAAIAGAVGMAKRSVYARYPNKAALFKASVQRAIEQWTVPVEALHRVESDDLEATLTAVARIRMANATTPAGLRLQRIVNTESYRFPEIFAQAFEQGTRPTIDFLANLLRRHMQAGAVSVTKPEIAATAFLSMVVGGPLRAVVWGKAMDPAAMEERIRFCVRLFLDGARPR